MFYVKENLNDAMHVTIEITDANVYCQCPVCGKEMAVNLEEILGDGEGDLMGTAVLCEECAKDWMEQKYGD